MVPLERRTSRANGDCLAHFHETGLFFETYNVYLGRKNPGEKSLSGISKTFSKSNESGEVIMGHLPQLPSHWGQDLTVCQGASLRAKGYKNPRTLVSD